MPRLLLIDDDRDCLTALSNRLRFTFRDRGVEVDIADSAATGLILAHAAPYDAIILDVVMPGINGLKFVEQLRRTQPHIPIILMSGWNIKSCEEQAARLRLMACLPKPIDFSQLRTLLHEALGEDKEADSVQRVVHHQPRQVRSLQSHAPQHR